MISGVFSENSIYINLKLCWKKKKNSILILVFNSYRFVTHLNSQIYCTFSDPQKKDLPETKNVQEIVIEHHVIKREAQERGHREISETRNVLTKVLMADRKTRGAQRSAKQGRYNWLYIHLISSFL